MTSIPLTPGHHQIEEDDINLSLGVPNLIQPFLTILSGDDRPTTLGEDP